MTNATGLSQLGWQEAEYEHHGRSGYPHLGPLGPSAISARVKVVKVVKSGALLGAHTQNGQVVKVVKPIVPCMCQGISPWGTPEVGPKVR